MRFEELDKKIKYMYPLYTYVPSKKELHCSWPGMLEEVVYKAEPTMQYEKILEIGGFDELSQRHTKITSLDETRVSLSPNIEQKGDYCFVRGYGEPDAYGRRAKALFSYNKKIIKPDPVLVFHNKYDSMLPEELIDVYKDHLLFHNNEGVYMINNIGQGAFVCNYPGMSETNMIEMEVKNDKFILSEYVYYDCDNKHGGWEKTETDLPAIVNALEKEKDKEEDMER